MAHHSRPTGTPDLHHLEQLAAAVATSAAGAAGAEAPTSANQLRCATSGSAHTWTSELADEREMAAIECQACPKRLWCITSALEYPDDELFGVWGGMSEAELIAERAEGHTPAQILARAQVRERDALLTLAVKSAARRHQPASAVDIDSRAAARRGEGAGTGGAVLELARIAGAA